VLITCPAGGKPPDQGICGTPFNVGSQTYLLLTGLSYNKTYTILVMAKNGSGQDVATSNNTPGMPYQPKKVFLQVMSR